LNQQTLTKYNVLVLISIAYIFSFTIRLIWLYQFQGTEQFMWNNQFMINTNDGYFFASSVQSWLEGTLLENSRVPDLFYTATITLTAFITKFTPFTIETAIFYMPVFISSLVVIPMILISKLFDMTEVGFFSALLGSIAVSYYNRTMIGYFDTDMFSAMAPMFILYFLLSTIKTERNTFAFLSALSFLIYPYLYDSGRSMIYAMSLLYMAYMLVFHRKDEFTYKSILLVTIGLINYNFYGQLILLIATYYATEKDYISAKNSGYISLALLPIFLYTGNVHGLILGKFAYYFERGTVDTGLKFIQVSQTIREAGQIPFFPIPGQTSVAERVSGSTLGFIVAIVGYIFLVIRKREFILALPLIGIGVFAHWGGLRFTIYAVPIAAISAVFFIYILASYIQDKFIYYFALISLTGAMLYPNIEHIIAYKVPTVMMKQEVEILDKLKKSSTSKDYVVAWWDYGYPIWYYGDKNTLIDGGKHSNDNFIVSEILLTTSQLEAARLSRLSVEGYVSSNYNYVVNTLFKNGQKDQVDVSTYLDELKYSDVQMPEKTRDIFLYLPMRMMDILPTIKMFSNIDLQTGKPIANPFYYTSQGFKEDGKVLYLGNNVSWDQSTTNLNVGKQVIPISQFVRVSYTKNGKLNIKQKMYNMKGLTIIYLAHLQRFLVLSNEYLNSTFIQMYIFENYDKNLFEPVSLHPITKIYKLKI